MKLSNNTSVKYVDFNHLILLSWSICNTSINELVKLSSVITPSNIYKVIPSAEYFILSTCNRVEIYFYSNTPFKILQIMKNIIANAYSNKGYIYDYSEYKEGMQAYIHLAKVTSGLNSLAMGEYQIQGQVKDSYRNALKDKHIGNYLISIIESALRTGKRVRSETSLGQKSISLSSLAIDLMLKKNKPIKEHPILIVGTGKMCNLAAKYFYQMGYKSIIFFSNKPNERDAIRIKYKSLVLPIIDLPKNTINNNLIFSAVSPDTPRISLESIGGYSNTFSIIDLSIPKYIIQSEIDTSFSYILDMDEIQKIAPDYLSNFQPEFDKCEEIIHQEINSFILDNKRRRELNISQTYI